MRVLNQGIITWLYHFSLAGFLMANAGQRISTRTTK
jgi:hypothetical protein